MGLEAAVLSTYLSLEEVEKSRPGASPQVNLHLTGAENEKGAAVFSDGSYRYLTQ